MAIGYYTTNKFISKVVNKNTPYLIFCGKKGYDTRPYHKSEEHYAKWGFYERVPVLDEEFWKNPEEKSGISIKGDHESAYWFIKELPIESVVVVPQYSGSILEKETAYILTEKGWKIN
jgi:hypothetical protein